MRWLILCALLCSCAQFSLAESPEADDSKTLKVLSNNVGIFPQQVLKQYPENVKEKKKNIVADEEERAKLLSQALIDFDGDPDVLLLQEIWSIKARDQLIKSLAPKYPYCEHPPAIGDGKTTIQAAGLMIFSKYPLRDFTFKEFTRGFGVDKLAQKGIIGAKLTKEGRTVAVFNTHLQAGGKRDPTVKPDQLRECDEFIREFAGEDAIAVMAGDFNIPSIEEDQYQLIFAKLTDAHDSYREESGPIKQTGRNKKFPTKRIDYLLTFGDTKAESTIVDPAGDRLSDHFAVFGTVKLD